MEKSTISRLLKVFKKTHSVPADVSLPPAWQNGVMQEIYAAQIARTSPFEMFAPRVAVAAAVMLVSASVPCVLTVNSVLSLLDAQMTDAALDSMQLYLFM